MLLIDVQALLLDKPATGQWTGGHKKCPDFQVMLGGFSLRCIFETFIETDFLGGRTTGFQKVILVYNQNILNLPEN